MIYEFIVDYMTTNGFAPSFRDIADGVGLKSLSSVSNHMLNLEKEGLIKTIQDCPRAIKLVGYELKKVR